MIFSYENMVETIEKSRSLGFISDRSIQHHIEHSLDFIGLIKSELHTTGPILDMGAGGGLPSLVWLQKDQSIEITALDAMNKRTDFLESIRRKYPALHNRFRVINGRAEELGHVASLREQFSEVVARGFGPPGITAECASSFVSIGGHIIVSGRPFDESERWDADALMSLGLEIMCVKEGEHSHAAIFRKTSSLKERYPRRFAAIKKSPLF